MAEASEVGPLTVVLIGATGATGKLLVGELLRRKSDVAKVTLLGRRKLTQVPQPYEVNIEEEESSGRLQQHIIDFENLTVDNAKQFFDGHSSYISCFGTTRKQAGSSDAFTHIDFGYNMTCAKIAKEANIKQMCLLSTQGANVGSWFLYLNSKGKLEKAVTDLEFPITSIYRPTLLDRKENARLGEKVAGLFMKRIEVETVAKCIANDLIAQHKKGVHEKPKVMLYENDAVLKLAKTGETS